MARAILTISTKNYGAWALRGWLMMKLAGVPFDEDFISPDDPAMKAEMLLLSPSFRVPALRHDGVEAWDTLAIGEYLHEIAPQAGLLPADVKARAHCRSICGEMHSGFAALRGALPMNLRAHFPGFWISDRVQADIDRVTEIWKDCLARYGGPYLFGQNVGIADAMYAPVVTRFQIYEVALDSECAAYCGQILALPAMQQWMAAALEESMEIGELEA
jgi:glutathione S-transferase